MSVTCPCAAAGPLAGTKIALLRGRPPSASLARELLCRSTPPWRPAMALPDHRSSPRRPHDKEPPRAEAHVLPGPPSGPLFPPSHERRSLGALSERASDKAP